MVMDPTAIKVRMKTAMRMVFVAFLLVDKAFRRIAKGSSDTHDEDKPSASPT